MAAFDALATNVAWRYRGAFAARGAKRAFRRSVAALDDYEFNIAIWEHNCFLAMAATNQQPSCNGELCSKCAQPIQGIMVPNSAGSYVHWGCVPVEARDHAALRPARTHKNGGAALSSGRSRRGEGAALRPKRALHVAALAGGD